MVRAWSMPTRAVPRTSSSPCDAPSAFPLSIVPDGRHLRSPARQPRDRGLNARWLILWCIAGLELFSWGKLPSLAAAIIVARRTVATIAMDSSLG